MSCWQNSNCGRWLPGASVAPAQPAAIWPPFPLSPNPLLQSPRRLRVGLRLPKLMIPLPPLVPRQQVRYQLAGFAAALSTPFFSYQPCFPPSFQFTWSKTACWNSSVCARCSALLSGSPQSQVLFSENSHTTTSVTSGSSTAIFCQSATFHLACNASEHKAFVFTWFLISRCSTLMSLLVLILTGIRRSFPIQTALYLIAGEAILSLYCRATGTTFKRLAIASLWWYKIKRQNFFPANKYQK